MPEADFRLATPRAVSAQAALLAAICHHAEHNRRIHWAERLISKAFGRPVASLTAGHLIVMHFEALAGLGPPPTVTRLQQAMGHARSVAGFLALLRGLRMVAQEPDPLDSRQRRLVPQPRLLEGLCRWMEGQLRCAALLGLVPQAWEARLSAEPAFYAALLRASRQGLNGALERIDAHPAWAWFHRHDAGDRIALRLLGLDAAARLAGQPGEIWLRGSAQEIAQAIGVSRSHVRNVLNGAEREGLLRHDAARRLVRLSPALREAFALWFRAELDWLAEAAQRAARETDACRVWTSPPAASR
ncbi:helix-turn-helix domain-containing protein [Pseudoroseomonas cervicalis]|uniref:helix-turn-helix domain-containing protein n=1 Tax=Teichococcus cervicalis TaxID=204525 RepID=UPI0022F18EB2|nr:helix-turn-helix domain-containing protein [Pseudoroseomonas cervicalis]WBV45155.1 hypothetical protein PFY06_20160 [Pseudoroseomonas cervicalis]